MWDTSRMPVLSSQKNKVAPAKPPEPSKPTLAQRAKGFFSRKTTTPSTPIKKKSLPPASRKVFETKRRTFVERQIGYGDVDEWNDLSLVDQVRIRGYSRALFKSFNTTKYFLQFLGRFPFKTKKLEDGSYTFTLNYCSISYAFFVLTTLIIFIIFILFTIGIFCIYIDIDIDIISSFSRRDLCGNTWGQAIIARNAPAIIFVWSQMMLTAAGSVYIITHGTSFLEFYNTVNEAVMQLDVDPTTDLFLNQFKGNVIFGTLFIVCIGLFYMKKLETLEEVSAFVIQGILLFFMEDVYLIGTQKVFTVKDYAEMYPKCKTTCKGCYGLGMNDQAFHTCAGNGCYNHLNLPTQEFEMIKWIGFIIIAYSLLGARAILRQLEFFCHVLVNLASTWNKRFLNYASDDKTINMEDPYRRRITDNLVRKDHYQIVKLYNVAEGNFSLILFVYYASVFFNLFCQFYYMALLSTQVTCAEAVSREHDAALKGLCFVNASLVNQTGFVNNTKNVLEAGFADGKVIFEDACSLRQKTIIRHASVATTVCFVVTLSSFIFTTLQADAASHQADVGFYRVRKRGYMSCRTKKERSVMHSLVFSFTGPKPFSITAAGYFPIRKKTIVVVIAAAFLYFLIIMSFKPGTVSIQDEGHRCFNGSDFVVKYPKVI